jgi:hypothetical protein
MLRQCFQSIKMKKQSIMKQLTLLIIAVLCYGIMLTSCKSKEENDNSSHIKLDPINLVQTQNAVLDSLVNFLLDMSAKDFYDNQPPIPINFRNVRVKSFGSNEENFYLICGQFLVVDNQNNQEWVSFATIKTDPYEQWIGSNALAYCENSKETSYTKTDLQLN